jgi:hypothetical protein
MSVRAAPKRSYEKPTVVKSGVRLQAVTATTVVTGPAP